MTADEIIGALGLSAHPEGGWYRETWRAGATITATAGGRATGTAILYLLRAGERSRWHRVDADEVWLFHAGAPLTLRIAADVAGAERVTLGPRVTAGERPQAVVPAGHWQSAVSDGDFTLVSCCVSPGFDFAGFEMAEDGFDIPDRGGLPTGGGEA